MYVWVNIPRGSERVIVICSENEIHPSKRVFHLKRSARSTLRVCMFAYASGFCRLAWLIAINVSISPVELTALHSRYEVDIHLHESTEAEEEYEKKVVKRLLKKAVTQASRNGASRPDKSSWIVVRSAPSVNVLSFHQPFVAASLLVQCTGWAYNALRSQGRINFCHPGKLYLSATYRGIFCGECWNFPGRRRRK